MKLETTIALNIQRFRLAAGLTQEALAEASGFKLTSIAAIEQGRRVPSIDTIARIAGRVAVEPWQLLKPKDR